MRINLLLTSEEEKAIGKLREQATIPATPSQILHVLIDNGIKAIKKPKEKVLSVEELAPR